MLMHRSVVSPFSGRRLQSMLLPAALSVLLSIVTGAAPLQAQTGDYPPSLFHAAFDYGSEATFTPVSFLLNDAFDILQLGNHDPDIWNREYRKDLRNLRDNLSSPLESIRRFGTHDFISQEVFPLHFSMERAQWAPNYELHLIGGGIAYRTLLEWYRARGVPRPGAFTLLNVAFARLGNEMNENHGRTGLNVDPIADLYLFDTASILLFQLRGVQHFFAETLHARVWGKQPSFTFPGGELHNTGQYYSFKWRLPGSQKTYLFHYVGLGALLGLSRQVGKDYHVSIAAGAKTAKGKEVDAASGLLTVVPAASGAIFVDRNHSLLASLQISDIEEDLVELNVYPGILPFGQTGAWLSASRSGKIRFGLTTRIGLGIGH